MSYLTDSHFHVDRFEETGEVNEMLLRARKAGVRRLFSIGGTEDANRRVGRLCANVPDAVWGVVGYDRDEAGKDSPREELDAMLSAPNVVGVGETGLDYHYGADTAQEQMTLLQHMLDVAAERGLPVILHSRDAERDTVRMISDHAGRWEGDPERIGVLHCFTGSPAFAERLLKLGMYISFSGIVTFKNAESIREVVRMVPSDRILIETDAPYLAPVPYRGKVNEPAYLVHTADCVAKLRGLRRGELAAITSGNAERLFGLRSLQG